MGNLANSYAPIRRISSSASRSARRAARPVAALSAAALFLAACSGNDPDTAAPAGGGASGGAMTVSFVEPAEGATLSAPFNVQVQSSVELGTTDTGLHHVHVWFDDNEDDYLLLEATSGQVTDSPTMPEPGQHMLTVSLRNADHSPAGPEAQIPVTVAEGSAPAPAQTDSGPGDIFGY